MLVLAGFVAVAACGWFVLDMRYTNVSSRSGGDVMVTVPEGSDVWEIAKILEEERLIVSPSTFVFGAWRDGLRGQFRAGTFRIPSNTSARDIAYILTGDAPSEPEDIRITFPEGWTMEQMADRLEANSLPGESFLALASAPSEELREEFPFLAEAPQAAALEGFLFPDTYRFDPDTQAETIIRKMLAAFEKKVYDRYEALFSGEENNLFETVTLASIVEGEVRTSADRKVVSGIFGKRLEVGMAIQSDATLAYVLEERKVQHGADELAVDSPYNTYKYPGLPPGPVSNPSLDAIEAALFPQESSYWYFLSNPETGATYFAEDFEEHKRNKVNAGL